MGLHLSTTFCTVTLWLTLVTNLIIQWCGVKWVLSRYMHVLFWHLCRSPESTASIMLNWRRSIKKGKREYVPKWQTTKQCWHRMVKGKGFAVPYGFFNILSRCCFMSVTCMLSEVCTNVYSHSTNFADTRLSRLGCGVRSCAKACSRIPSSMVLVWYKRGC